MARRYRQLGNGNSSENSCTVQEPCHTAQNANTASATFKISGYKSTSAAPEQGLAILTSWIGHSSSLEKQFHRH